MPEKKSFWKKIESSKKLQVIVFVVSMVVIVGGYLGIYEHVELAGKTKPIQKAEIQDGRNFLTSVEESTVIDGKVILSGWAMRLDSVTKDIYVTLKNVSSGEEIVLATDICEREDMEKYFNPDWDFGKVGYEASIQEKRVQKNTCYEILIYLSYEVRYEEEDDKYIIKKYEQKTKSGKYLYNGSLYQYNPEMFEKPEFKEEELCKVIDEGILRTFDNDKKIWVYQKDLDFYFFIKDNEDYGDWENIVVPFMPRTSRVDLLPEERKIYGFDHRGFFAAREQLYEAEGDLYRVVVATISEEYPVTYISTGIYNAKNKTWIQEITLECEN